MGIKEFVKARPLRAKDNSSTSAAELTLRQSIFPIVLVTTLFFLWGFSYGTSTPTGVSPRPRRSLLTPCHARPARHS